MIDEQDKALRKRFGSQVPGEAMEPDALVKGSLMQLNEDGTVNTNEGAIQVANGIVFPLYFKDKDEAAKFNDKKVGDKVVFNPWKASAGDAGELASMLNIDKAIAADVKNDFELNISEIIVAKPAELGDEYYKTVFGEDKVHNEEEYRNELKGMIKAELENNSHILFRNQFDKAMMEKYGNMELPAAIIKKVFFGNAEDPDKVFEDNKRFIEHEVIEANLIDKLGITVSEDEILDMTKMLTARQFAQYGMAGLDDEIITRYAKEQLQKDEVRNRVEEQVRTAKSIAQWKCRNTRQERSFSRRIQEDSRRGLISLTNKNDTGHGISGLARYRFYFNPRITLQTKCSRVLDNAFRHSFIT